MRWSGIYVREGDGERGRDEVSEYAGFMLYGSSG